MPYHCCSHHWFCIYRDPFSLFSFSLQQNDFGNLRLPWGIQPLSIQSCCVATLLLMFSQALSVVVLGVLSSQFLKYNTDAVSGTIEGAVGSLGLSQGKHFSV